MSESDSNPDIAASDSTEPLPSLPDPELFDIIEESDLSDFRADIRGDRFDADRLIRHLGALLGFARAQAGITGPSPWIWMRKPERV